MLQKLLDAKADPVAKAKQVGTALMMARGVDGSVGKGDGVMGVMLMVGWSAGLRLVDVLMLVEVSSSSARWSGNT